MIYKICLTRYALKALPVIAQVQFLVLKKIKKYALDILEVLNKRGNNNYIDGGKSPIKNQLNRYICIILSLYYI